MTMLILQEQFLKQLKEEMMENKKAFKELMGKQLH